MKKGLLKAGVLLLLFAAALGGTAAVIVDYGIEKRHHTKI